MNIEEGFPGGAKLRSGQWRYCESCGRCHAVNSKSCLQSESSVKPRYAARDDYRPGWKTRSGEIYHGDMAFEVPQEEFEQGGRGQEHWQEEQTHVHEFQGSTKLAEFDEDVHNHRFAGISGEAVKFRGSHIHKIWTRTDFFDHFHFICKFTGPAIPVDVDEDDDDGMCGKHRKRIEKHIHYIEGFTTEQDGHRHGFEFATMIDSPLLPESDPE